MYGNMYIFMPYISNTRVDMLYTLRYASAGPGRVVEQVCAQCVGCDMR